MWEEGPNGKIVVPTWLYLAFCYFPMVFLLVMAGIWGRDNIVDNPERWLLGAGALLAAQMLLLSKTKREEND